MPARTTFPASLLSELLDRGEGATSGGVKYLYSEPYDVRDWHADVYVYLRAEGQPAGERWRVVARVSAGGHDHAFLAESPEGVPAQLERQVTKTVAVWEDAVSSDKIVCASKGPVVAFDPHDQDGGVSFYDAEGEPVEHVEAILRIANRGRGEVVAVIHSAEWHSASRVSPWHTAARSAFFAESPREVARLRREWGEDLFQFRAEGPRRQREVDLAVLLQLPDDFVDRLVARLEAADAGSFDEEVLEEAERLAAIKAAVAKHRSSRK